MAEVLGSVRPSVRFAADTSTAPLQSFPTVRMVAPHIRAAHWQHYWTGKRKGRTDGRFGDELVIRWVPPTPVNEGRGAVAETIHR